MWGIELLVLLAIVLFAGGAPQAWDLAMVPIRFIVGFLVVIAAGISSLAYLAPILEFLRPGAVAAILAALFGA